MEDVKDYVVRRAQQILHQHQHHPLHQQQSVIVNVIHSHGNHGSEHHPHQNHINPNQQPLQEGETLQFHHLQNSDHHHIQNQGQPHLNIPFLEGERTERSQDQDRVSPQSSLAYPQEQPNGEEYSHHHPHLCTMCDKGFPTPARLNRHLKTHLNEEEKPYRCDLCSKSFSAKWNLDRHVKESHEGVKRDRPSRKDDPDRPKRPEEFHKCPICEKAFSHRTSLTRHIRSHSDDKPYECDICEKSFVQASDLDRHRRVHTGEKPFQCNQCDRAFTQSANLSRHLKYHETLKAKKIVYGRDMNLLKDVVDYKKLHDLKKDKGSDDDDEETATSSGAQCQDDYMEEDEDEDPLSD